MLEACKQPQAVAKLIRFSLILTESQVAALEVQISTFPNFPSVLQDNFTVKGASASDNFSAA